MDPNSYEERLLNAPTGAENVSSSTTHWEAATDARMPTSFNTLEKQRTEREAKDQKTMSEAVSGTMSYASVAENLRKEVDKPKVGWWGSCSLPHFVELVPVLQSMSGWVMYDAILLKHSMLVLFFSGGGLHGLKVVIKGSQSFGGPSTFNLRDTCLAFSSAIFMVWPELHESESC